MDQLHSAKKNGRLYKTTGFTVAIRSWLEMAETEFCWKECSRCHGFINWIFLRSECGSTHSIRYWTTKNLRLSDNSTWQSDEKIWCQLRCDIQRYLGNACRIYYHTSGRSPACRSLIESPKTCRKRRTRIRCIFRTECGKMLEFCEVILRTDGHKNVFCSRLQFQLWKDSLWKWNPRASKPLCNNSM